MIKSLPWGFYSIPYPRHKKTAAYIGRQQYIIRTYIKSYVFPNAHCKVCIEYLLQCSRTVHGGYQTAGITLGEGNIFNKKSDATFKSHHS